VSTTGRINNDRIFIPLSLDGIDWRNKLFPLDEGITMPAEKFDEL